VPQNLLLTEHQFCRFSEERGNRIGLNELETFEELGLLYPLCRLRLPLVDEQIINGEIRRRYAPLVNISHQLLKWYKDGYCEDPIKTKFHPWKEYKDGFQDTSRVLYHPLQFFTFMTIDRHLGHRLSVPLLLDPDRFTKLREKVQRTWKSLKKWVDFIDNMVMKDFYFFPFYLSIEDIYLPIVRSTFIGNPWISDHGDSIWVKMREVFNPKKVLIEFDLKLEQIKNWRTRLAAKAKSVDPLAKWYLLVKNTKYSKRKKLSGAALLAQDLYEMVDVIGLFLEDLTGKRPLDADDMFGGFHGEWKKEFYGGTDFENREILRKLVYEYGLDYDYKVLLFLEGDTELHAIPKIANAMGFSFANLGIRIEKLGGYTEIKPERITKLLKYSYNTGVKNYIIIDNHKHTKKFLDKLIDARNLGVTKGNTKVWNIDFEKDNFSVKDLIAATTRLAEKAGINLEITPKMVENAQNKKPEVGIANILINMCEEQEFVLKKSDLGDELGLLIAERIREGQILETKIEQEILKIVRLVR
jgi:hypothetical protein